MVVGYHECKHVLGEWFVNRQFIIELPVKPERIKLKPQTKFLQRVELFCLYHHESGGDNLFQKRQ